MTESILMWLYENHRRSSSSSIEMDPIINETFYHNLMVTDVGTKSIIDDVTFISNLTTINGTDEIGTTHSTNTNDPNMAYYGHIFSKLNSEYRSIHGYLSLVVCVFGIIANVLNIIVLTRRNMESPTNTILTGMAVSDLLVIASYIPYVIHNYIRTEVPPEQMYNYGWAVFTLFHAHNTVLFHTISIWLTVLLAVWRYITVRTPLRTRSMLTIVQARLYIMLVYIMVPVFCIPVFISFTIHKMDWTEQNRNISIYKVDIVHLEGKNHYLLEKITFWVFSVFLKLIPCGLLTWITLALIHILIEARKRKERLLKGNIGMNQNSNRINTSSSNNVNLSRNNSNNQLMSTPSIATHPTAPLYSQHHLHPNNQQQQQHHHQKQQQQSLQHRYSQPVNSLTPRIGPPQQHLQVFNNSIRSNDDNNKTNVHLEMETCLECDPSSTNSSKVVNSSSNDSSSAASDTNTSSSSSNISNNNRTSFTKFCFRCGNCLQTTKRKFTSATTMLKTNYSTTTSNTTTTTMAAQQHQHQQSTQSKSKRQQKNNSNKNNSKQQNLNNKIKLKFRSSSGCSISGGGGGYGQSSSNICSSSSTSSSSAVAVSSTTTTLAANAATTTTTTTATNTGTATTTTGNPSSSASTSSGNSERTTRMLIAVLIMFLVCEFPSGILALLSGILGKLFFKNVYNNFGDIMDMLALINSAVNFVLYCLMSQQFRKTFSHLFCIRWTEEISGQHHGSGVSGINRRTSGGSISKSRPISIKNNSNISINNNNKCDQKKILKHHQHNQKHQEITTTEFIESNSNENVCLLVNKNNSNINNNGQSSNGVDTIINQQTNLDDVADNSFENDDQLSNKNGSSSDYNNIKMVMLNNGKNNNQNKLFSNKKIKCNNNNNNNNDRMEDNDNSGNDLKHEKKLLQTALTNDDDDDGRMIAIKNSTQHQADFPSPTSVALKESNTINFATTIASTTAKVAAGATILITDQHQRTTEIIADDVYDHEHNYDNQNNDDDHDDIDDAELNDCSTSV